MITAYKGVDGLRLYTIGNEIGKGGEGQVFEVRESPATLLKIYTEELGGDKTDKLRYMTTMQQPAIHRFTAWPLDLAIHNGRVEGFVMNKLTGYVPLHMLFNPMDRKKLFPDKGYNFLVHVARNLATAFHSLHEEGLIIGDVNEGNILVNPQGMVAFIDCDSFQIKNNDQYYFCEVGVPRYTPPELLSAKSFSQVVRTVNTDAFSLAILLFQILFLGRHPFAGRNNSAEDFDEERAIRELEFAYSLKKQYKRLLPPLNSFDIADLSDELIALFHHAFENLDQRPAPKEWMVALDIFSKDIITCGKTKIHTYPKTMESCPWCDFQAKKGIVYFLDDSGQNILADNQEFAKFISGFKTEKLSLEKFRVRYLHTPLTQGKIDPRWYKYRRLHLLTALAGAAIIAGFAVVHAAVVFLAPIFLVMYHTLSPFRRKIERELVRGNTLIQDMKKQQLTIVMEYDHPKDLKPYRDTHDAIRAFIKEYNKLPDRYRKERRLVEEKWYHKQLAVYLAGFLIVDFPIPSFGEAKKQLLYHNGILTAADISRLNKIKITGIGPKNIQILISWQQQMANGFEYKPDYEQLNKELATLSLELSAQKSSIENSIRQLYTSLRAHKNNILNRQTLLTQKYNEIDTAISRSTFFADELKQLLRYY